MDDAKQSRISAKGWLTRASTELSEKLKMAAETAETSAQKLVAVEGKMEQLRLRLERFDTAQHAVEAYLTTEDDLLADIEHSADFRAKSTDLLEEAEVWRRSHVTQATGQDGGTQPAPDVKPLDPVIAQVDRAPTSNSRLPKLELPHFDGKILEWQPFWDQFCAVVDNTSLPNISKFTYMQSLLSGEAKSVIAGLPTTEANYVLACRLLRERYDRRDRIIYAHIQALLNVKVSPTSKSMTRVATLWQLQDTLLSHVRALEALDISGKQYGVLLCPIILSRLPDDIRIEWARVGKEESDLDALLTFLKTEIQCIERSDAFKSNPASGTKPKSMESVPTSVESSAEKPSSVASLQAISESSKPKCGFCGKRHPTAKCWGVTKLSVEERVTKIQESRLCFRCLSPSHIARNCTAMCSKCRGRHHALICRGSSSTSSSGPNRAGQVSSNSGSTTSGGQAALTSSVSDSVGAHSQGTVLQTARVFVRGSTGTVRATLLFDSGSDRSYVTSGLVDRLKLGSVSTHSVSYSAFGSGKVTGARQCKVYDLELEGVTGGVHTLQAAEIPVICTPMSRKGVPRDLVRAFGPLRFADSYTADRDVTIDILVGLDFYWKYMKVGFVRIPSLVAQETVFGWIVSGSWTDGDTQLSQDTSVTLCALSDIPDSRLQTFWDLDSVGIAPKESGPTDVVLEKFNEDLVYIEEEKRYEVCLPWRDHPGPSELVNNENIARRRLKNLSKYLDAKPALKKVYNEVLSEMEETGIIAEIKPEDKCTDNPVFYLPHRPVVKESSLTTKVRPVFDASVKSYNGLSLNDCMEIGPSLIPNLVAILIRFRRWQVGLSSDVTKAFLQLKLNPKDQDVHRFLWEGDDGVRVMKILRVPFGNRSSPFLLNATIKAHLSKFPPSRAKEELEENLYIDDWITGSDTDSEGCELFKRGCEIMSEASLSLAKCSSNSPIVSDMLSREFGNKHIDAEFVKILGMIWTVIIDCFQFHGIELPETVKSTKRAVLSFIARLFDPLGFLNPFVIALKILFQKLWKLQIDWDEELPAGLLLEFQAWIRGTQVLKSWEIPRCFFIGHPWGQLVGNDVIELHMFCDAADKQAYGACVYIRIPDHHRGGYKVSYVVSKVRVAPLRPVTLPRLELLGALLGARLLSFVVEALKLSRSVKYRCWTDSTVALAWIQGSPARWKTFVSNRVVEIQKLTSPQCWLHCPGEWNPADLLTRGISAEKLVASQIWLNGPSWLAHCALEDMSEECSQQPQSVNTNEVCEEVALVSVEIDPSHPFPFERWGSYGRAVRIVAYVLRFISNLKSRRAEKRMGSVTVEEFDAAELIVLSCIQKAAYSSEISSLQKGGKISRSSSIAQLSPFLGEDGLLRVRGRLQFSDLVFETKHPVILPRCHVTLLLIRARHVSLSHAGVGTMITSLRGRFWIIGLRRMAKRVKSECVHCRKLDTRACCLPSPPLPALRVKEAPAFSVTGLDFAGPVYCLDFPGSKFYILLFTCAVVRAVHLELTDSMSVDDFMLAVRRFVSRRGLPSAILSDNAKTFIAASEKLLALLGTNCPRFIRINPLSPWWGGWWERLVRSVKLALKKSIGKNCLTKKELETHLVEAEAHVNSRPLTVVGDSLDALAPLTPFHFLIGPGGGYRPSVDLVEEVVTSDALSVREKLRLQRLDKFWSVWSRDYLCNLPPTVHKFQARGDLQLGSVVLIKEDHQPRLQWPLGVVVEMYPGRDGLCRSVKLRTAKGFLVRSIQRLYDLEVDSTKNGPRGTLAPNAEPDNIPETPEGVDSLAEHVGSGDSAVEDNSEDFQDVDISPEVQRTTRSGRVVRPRNVLNL